MESLVKEIGVCGRFQTIQVTLVQLCRFSAAWAVTLMVFGLYNPGWHCNKTNLTTINPLEGASKFVQHLNATNSYEVSMKSLFNGTCSIIDTCDTIEFNPSSSTVVTEFELICDYDWKSKLIVTVLNCGMLTGAFIWGQIGERFGRKASLYGGNFIMTVACGLAIISSYFGWKVYVVLTFFIGFGAVGVIPTANVLSMEFLSSTWRTRVASFPIWNGGVICLAVACYLLRDWKYIHLASTCVGGLAFLGFFWAPESLRWLAVHDKMSKATKVIKKISKVNNKVVSSKTLNEFLNTERSNQNARNYTYLDLFRTGDMRLLTVKLGFLWSISIMTYEVIGYGIQSLPGDFYTNIIISSCMELPGLVLVGPLANKLGRRRTGILFNVAGMLSSAVIVASLVAMDKSNLRDLVVTGVALFNRLMAFATFSLMIAFGAELIPTPIRNLAFGLFNMATRATGMIASNLIPRDFRSLVICYGVLTAGQCITSLIIWTLDETKGKPLLDGLKNKTTTRPQIDSNQVDGIERIDNSVKEASALISNHTTIQAAVVVES